MENLGGNMAVNERKHCPGLNIHAWDCQGRKANVHCVPNIFTYPQSACMHQVTTIGGFLGPLSEGLSNDMESLSV